MATGWVTEKPTISSADTWTEVLGSSKGLSDFNATGSDDVAYVTIFIENFDTTNDNTIEVAIKVGSSAPGDDTETVHRDVLGILSTGTHFTSLDFVIKNTQHVFVKSNRTSTRVRVEGPKEPSGD